MKPLEIRLSAIAPVVSGVLLFLAFPVYDQGWLAWFAMMPLILALYGRRPVVGFFLAFLCGLVYFAGIFDWILDVNGYELHHHAILVPYLSIYFGLFGLIFCFLSRRIEPFGAIFMIPFVWISLEYLRSNLFFLGLPWALLGHTQHQFLPIVQMVSFTGVYGLSFLIALVNASLAMGALALPQPSWFPKTTTKLPGKRQAAAGFAAVLLLVATVLIYGQTVLSEPSDRESINVSVLQANIEHSKRYDRRYDDYVMQTYVDLSRTAAADNPDLIVWPEAATPGFILKNMKYYQQAAALIKETGSFYLIGSSEFPKFSKEPFDPEKSGNTALMFSPEGKVIDQYIKIRLVPFVEYIPYKDVVTWPRFIVSEGRRTQIIGDKFVLFDIKNKKCGVAICWESIYPDLFRKFVKAGAEFMLNISSESWFEETIFQRQFLAMTTFRAVENRVSIARSGNNSFACFIDPFGRITARVQDSDDTPIEKGHLTRDVLVSKSTTFYTRFGNLFAHAAIGVTLLVVAMAVIKPKPQN